MPSVLLYLLLPVPVALMAAGIALKGRPGLRRPQRRRRTRAAVPGGTRRDFFGDCVGADVAAPVAAPREQPVVPAPAPSVAQPAPVMGPRAVPDPAPAGAERAA
jgi:hypothetical protein